MARGKQLGTLLTDLRAEVGHSLNAAHGKNMRDALVHQIQRTQEWLWEDNDWSFLRVTDDKKLQAGQHLYDMPLNMQQERVEEIHIKWGSLWEKLERGIDAEAYNIHDTDRGIRVDPVQKWAVRDNDQIEVWPTPASTGNATTKDLYLRFTGIRDLNPLIDDSDTADLDDRLIVLFAAAEILARQKSKDAQAKMDIATQHYNKIKGRLSSNRAFIMGGGEEEPAAPRIRVAYTG